MLTTKPRISWSTRDGNVRETTRDVLYVWKESLFAMVRHYVFLSILCKEESYITILWHVYILSRENGKEPGTTIEPR